MVGNTRLGLSDGADDLGVKLPTSADDASMCSSAATDVTVAAGALYSPKDVGAKHDSGPMNLATGGAAHPKSNMFHQRVPVQPGLPHRWRAVTRLEQKCPQRWWWVVVGVGGGVCAGSWSGWMEKGGGEEGVGRRRQEGRKCVCVLVVVVMDG